MIDGISGGSGLIRGPIGQRAAPAETTSADPARGLRRNLPGNYIAPARTGRSALVADLAKAPPVNAARVAELKAQIEGGRYPVDPLRIADAMLKLDRGRP
ncbi:flagellar biosynthesis anti-sigma factor FlgM [Sandarakinorhabdus limnophila]|uniref:flagellar biosynthesis anti-sigma factor FlgM n=1 Tax=Sandarakinorhabdus limnophila TaxID=210512 RepID=UPI0026F12321|nr:flagellar biosynthesis anti-sigma factor FlgM [Sandarakinorhabdus limnophila]MCM0033678.1 flagellar biosynthesis anti-sigma factor FlgM [Sandarakinorhabdus limnophila]